jgi:hypothetical protein
MERKEMIYLLADQLCNGNVAVFFLQVYQATFGKVGDVSNDYSLFYHLGILPSYMEDFLNEVERNSNNEKDET